MAQLCKLCEWPLSYLYDISPLCDAPPEMVSSYELMSFYVAALGLPALLFYALFLFRLRSLIRSIDAGTIGAGTLIIAGSMRAVGPVGV